MKRILLLEFCFLFLATTFQGDRLTGWVQQTIPRPDLAVRDLQFLDSLTGFMVSTKPAVDTAFIFKTTDGGNNWSTTHFVNYYLISLHFVDKNIGYCAGSQSTNAVVLKTTNGGDNWFNTTYVSGFIFLNDVMFVNKDTGWVTSNFVVSGGLWRTINGGVNWQMQLNDSFNPSKIFFVNNSTGWMIGNSGGNLYKTTNCGGNWNLQYNFGSSLDDVFFATSDTGWLIGGGVGTGIMRSINGGNNWNPCNNPTPYGTAKLFFTNNRIGWAGSGLNKIVATKNGYDWAYQTSPIFNNYNVSFIDSSKGWAGASGLVHTTDGGGPIVSTNELITEIPKEYQLGQNFPNPFNQFTIINYQLLITSDVKIKVYDISGKEITTLVNGRINAGKYSVSFNASKLSSGIYFYALFADGKRLDTKRMSLVK
jgi:photosystem II stability/assembly factor-like uncharacterized protein